MAMNMKTVMETATMTWKLALVLCLWAAPALAQNVMPRTLVPLRVATVTTGGTAVQALNVDDRMGGGFLFNPSTATAPLCINELAVAAGTISAGSLVCLAPGAGYQLAPARGVVSVVSSDSAHPFAGYGVK